MFEHLWLARSFKIAARESDATLCFVVIKPVLPEVFQRRRKFTLSRCIVMKRQQNAAAGHMRSKMSDGIFVGRPTFQQPIDLRQGARFVACAQCHQGTLLDQFHLRQIYSRSEERRVGKECRSRWSP